MTENGKLSEQGKPRLFSLEFSTKHPNDGLGTLGSSSSSSSHSSEKPQTPPRFHREMIQNHTRILPMSNGNMSPKQGSSRSKKPLLNLSFLKPNVEYQREKNSMENSLKTLPVQKNILKLPSGRTVEFNAHDLIDMGEIGRGAFGAVYKMVYKESNFEMAVKRIPYPMDEKRQKQTLREMLYAMSSDYPYIVKFYGTTSHEGAYWICIELMDTSLDKFYKYVYDHMKSFIPEHIIANVTLSTVEALNYLKTKHSIIHRDVKPSNILLDKRGHIKLCDFGISGILVNSEARSKDAGCQPYMAPERIKATENVRGYDVRSDVWSLGVSLVEVATGAFPYAHCASEFAQLEQIVTGPPPRLPPASHRSSHLHHIVAMCLTKEVEHRPKYQELMKHPFIAKMSQDLEKNRRDVAAYVCEVFDHMKKNNISPYDHKLSCFAS